MFVIIIASICKHMNSIGKKTSAAGSDKEERKFNTKNLIVAIGLSITFGLGWGFGFLVTSHEITALVILFQAIFIIAVGSQGVLLFIFHGARNPEVQELWKKVFFAVSRKTRKVYSLTQSTTDSKASKQTTLPTSPSTDLLTVPSSTVKSPSITFSEHSIGTMDTTIDFEPNPAYGDIKPHSPTDTAGTMDTNMDFQANPAYGDFKRDPANTVEVVIANEYEIVKQDLSAENNLYEKIK